MGGPGAPKKLKNWEKSQLFLINSQLDESQFSKKTCQIEIWKTESIHEMVLF